MNYTETNYNITKADNGYIVNATVETETQKNDVYSSTYDNKTYVFPEWKNVIEWLSEQEKEQG